MAETRLAKQAAPSDEDAVANVRNVNSLPVKNHLRNACIALLFSFLTVYALGSYIAWDLNPGHWTADGRLIGAVVSVLGCILMFFGLERV